MNMASTTVPVVCGECKTTLEDISALNAHYRDHHSHLSVVKCGQHGCQTSFLNKTSLIRHLKEDHGAGASKLVMQTSAVLQTCNVSHAFASSSRQDFDGDTVCDIEPMCIDREECEVPPPQNMKDVAALTTLEMRSSPSLTAVAVERFQDGCLRLLSAQRDNYKFTLSSILLEKGLSPDDLSDVLSSVDYEENIFSHVKTIEDQLDYYSQELGLVKPREYFLDTRVDKRLDPSINAYVPTQVNESFQYIPIIETLTSLLKCKKYRENMFKDFSSTDGVLRSYLDGKNMKDHPFLRKHSNVIHLLLWYDDLEVADALGSKTSIHKLGVFLLQVLNGRPETKSNFASIHLLALAYSEDLKEEAALNKVLGRIVSEMKKLSSDKGVKITLDGKPFILQAILVAVSAHSLAAHEILGFLSPSASRFCRKCMIIRRQFRQNGNVMAEERTPEDHDHQVEAVLQTPRLSSQFGVKRKCLLNEIPYFHCVTGSVFDIFHDYLEGIVPFTIKMVLRHIIYIKRYLSVQDFNAKVASFSYGVPDSKNKPSANFVITMLSTGMKIHQSGSQMWCLIRVLPFLIADKVPEGDEYMELVFVLQDILKIVFSFEIRPHDLESLYSLTSKFLDWFKVLFIDGESQWDEQGDSAEDSSDSEEELDPDEALENVRRRVKRLNVYLTNKMHHAKHTVDQILEFGPVRQFWCAKFEAELRVFRQHAAVCCNFENIPKTMAQMFQLSNLKYYLDSQQDHPIIESQSGSIMSIKEVEQLYVTHNLFLEFGLEESNLLKRTNSATFQGEGYRPGLFLNFPSQRMTPMFSIISDVFVQDDKVLYLLVKPWRVLGLSAKYNAHYVAPDDHSQHSVEVAHRLTSFRAIAPWVTDDGTIYLSVRTTII